MKMVIQLGKKEVPYEDVSVPVKRLAFYPENPRIYSRFAGPTGRTQEHIQSLLEKMEHVKELRSQIDRDGQVNEPPFCIPVPKDSELSGEFDYQVLEGNSRLAALRITNPGSLPQASLICHILDFSAYGENEREGLIFSLLGQYHITGKTKWESYENAAYIYRRHKNQGVRLDEVARDIGQTRAKVQKMIEAFEMMTEAGDNRNSNWSYYLTYVSSTKIKKQRQNIAGLDVRIISLIKDRHFPRAMDMRDKLPAILGNRKARKIFLDEDEKDPFSEALDVADVSGDTNATYKRLERFRKELGRDDIKKQIRKLLRDAKTMGKTEYELKQITKFAGELLKKRVAS